MKILSSFGGVRPDPDGLWMVTTLARFFVGMGPLRSLLAITTVSLVALAPFALLDPSGVVRGAVVPALATLVAFVLPLDMSMSRVFMSGAEAPEVARYARIIRCEAWLLVLLVSVWVPTLWARLGSG